MNNTISTQLKIGQKVKVKDSVQQLRFGWGFFTKDSVGFISAVHNARIDVEFPEQHATFLADELEIVGDVEQTVVVTLKQFKAMTVFALMGYLEHSVEADERIDKVNKMLDTYEKKFGAVPLTKEDHQEFLNILEQQLNYI